MFPGPLGIRNNVSSSLNVDRMVRCRKYWAGIVEHMASIGGMEGAWRGIERRGGQDETTVASDARQGNDPNVAEAPRASPGRPISSQSKGDGTL